MIHEKRALGCLGYKGDLCGFIILPSYEGIFIINHYKDPYDCNQPAYNEK